MFFTNKKSGLGRFLLDRGIISKEGLKKAIKTQKTQSGKRIGEILSDINLIGEEELLKQLAEYLKVEYVSLSEIGFDMNKHNFFAKNIMIDWCFAPFKIENNVVNIAIDDIYNLELQERIKDWAKGYEVKFYLSLKNLIINFIKESYAKDINKFEFKGRKEKFGEYLIKRGIVTQEQFGEVLEEQQKYLDKRVGEIICDMGILSQEKALMELAKHLKKEYICLEQVHPDKSIQDLFQTNFMLKKQIVPFEIEDDCVKIAIANILDFELIEIIETRLSRKNLKAHFYLAQNDSIQKCIEQV